MVAVVAQYTPDIHLRFLGMVMVYCKPLLTLNMFVTADSTTTALRLQDGIVVSLTYVSISTTNHSPVVAFPTFIGIVNLFVLSPVLTDYKVRVASATFTHLMR